MTPGIRTVSWRAAALLALLAAWTAPGCNRKTQLVPADADSTVAIDSSAIRVREAQALWEAAASGEAAEATARVLRERIASVSTGEWQPTAELLLDSLGVGFESSADECALLVNLFSRSDPSAGSWPYLFTCTEEGPRHQAVEGKNLQLAHVVSRGVAIDAPESPGPGVAALYARRAGAGRQPVLMVWSAKEPGGRWDLAQTLGADSLGGTGEGRFETVADTTIELVTRTYRTPPSFSECATCPHLDVLHRFRWSGKTFVRAAPDSVVSSPYAAFVTFIQALVANDRDRALSVMSDDRLWDQARRLEWGARRGAWRVAPGAGETAAQMTFFRGAQEAYRVHFERHGHEWRITAFEETTRSLE